MVRIAIVITALLAPAGTTAVNVSVARAQGSAVERCIAKCKQGGTWKGCDKWCEDRAR
jgi:hypothetical protein